MAFWGFTVDDALITARVAHHLANGTGYRFNPAGAVVDAVTPLGFAYLLAPFAHRDPWSALLAAKALGVIAWTCAAAFLGTELARVGTLARSLSVVPVLAVCLPLAAWSVAGMETGLVIALATFALAEHRLAALCAGLAAAWRPELLPWAAILSLGRGLAHKSAQRAVLELAYATAPAICVALLRTAIFGIPAPLAAFAKPSDLSHGARYAFGAWLFSGIPLLLFAPRALRQVPARIQAIAIAVFTHWLSMLAAGGDWMAFYRLAAPVLPGALLVGAHIANISGWFVLLVRTAGSTICAATLLIARGPDARHILEQRKELSARARNVLTNARHIATLDAGWVGASSRAEIIDLAGVTDPSVAYLRGGHTSKAITQTFLESRSVDTLVLLLQSCSFDAENWWNSAFSRTVEQRVARFEFAKSFVPKAKLELQRTPQCYLVLQRLPDTTK